MSVIDNLFKIMSEKGISAYQIEKDIGINQTTFYNWKKGKQPPADKLQKIITYLEVSPNEVFGYENSQKLSDNDKELLELFHQLSEREQIKLIGKVEELVERGKTKDG